MSNNVNQPPAAKDLEWLVCKRLDVDEATTMHKYVLFKRKFSGGFDAFFVNDLSNFDADIGEFNDPEPISDWHATELRVDAFLASKENVLPLHFKRRKKLQ